MHKVGDHTTILTNKELRTQRLKDLMTDKMTNKQLETLSDAASKALDDTRDMPFRMVCLNRSQMDMLGLLTPELVLMMTATLLLATEEEVQSD